MFGYLIPDIPALTADQRALFRAGYCGVCRALGRRYGAVGRAALSYDAAFAHLALLCAAGGAEAAGCAFCSGRCAAHPFRKRPCLDGSAAELAADVDLILTGFSLEDRVRDRDGVLAPLGARLVRRSFEKACAARPAIADAVRRECAEIVRLEREGILDPEPPAAATGRLLAAALADGGAAAAAFGDAAGRLVYLLDAACDLKRDLKRMRYNPFAGRSAEGAEGLIRLTCGECAARLDALPACAERELLRNVVTDGVWLRYRLKTGREGA